MIYSMNIMYSIKEYYASMNTQYSV